MDASPDAGNATTPARVDDIDAAWLNSVLDNRFGTIESVAIDHFGEGVGILGELARITLTYADGHAGPATVVAKCQSPSPENIGLATVMGFYLREANFYREIAIDIDIRVPQPYFVDAHPTGSPFVLVIEDIVGATCPDQIVGLTLDEVRAIMSAIIPLHAAYWGSPELDELDWLPPMNNDLYKGGKELGLALWDGYVERYGERVGAQMLDTVAAGLDQYVELLDHVVGIGTPTFTHTDCRAENYLFGGSAGDDAVTVVDFQLSTRHWGMWDLTNLLGGSVEPGVRRACEHDLIAWYVDQLAGAGVTGYDVEQATLEYRWCLLHQTIAGVMVSDLDGGNERGTRLLEELFLRPVAAAEDNAVWELLDHLG